MLMLHDASRHGARRPDVTHALAEWRVVRRHITEWPDAAKAVADHPAAHRPYLKRHVIS